MCLMKLKEMIKEELKDQLLEVEGIFLQLGLSPIRPAVGSHTILADDHRIRFNDGDYHKRSDIDQCWYDFVTQPKLRLGLLLEKLHDENFQPDVSNMTLLHRLTLALDALGNPRDDFPIGYEEGDVLPEYAAAFISLNTTLKVASDSEGVPLNQRCQQLSEYFFQVCEPYLKENQQAI